MTEQQAQERSLFQDLPAELIQYFDTLLSPPGENTLLIDASGPWEVLEERDSSVSGIIAAGTPTEAQVAELMRVLKPGGHLLLIAPDEELMGHTGACRAEDAGFEVRDAILILDSPRGFHYVAKASRREREEGCSSLAGKSGSDATDRKEGTAGLQSPRAGAGRTAEHVRNFHPTVKPVELMRRLIESIPKSGPILDPFLGSGTTAIAAVAEGHSAIGIEREKEYLEIADARVRHKIQSHLAYRHTVHLQSEGFRPPPAPAPISILDELCGSDD